MAQRPSANIFFQHPWIVVVAGIIAFLAGAQKVAAQSSPADCVTVRMRSFAAPLHAYGQVEPIATLPVNAAETGIVAGLSVVPGTRVRAGQVLARLAGPGIRALQLQDEADVRSAQSALRTAQQALAIQRQQLRSHLSTRVQVHQAESGEAQAQASLDNAQSRLNALQRMATVSAPAAGVILALNSGNGELVAAGQPIVTLLPKNRLWLKATYYGSNLALLRAGMKGVFAPSDGQPAFPVRVISVYGSLDSGAGESVAMASTEDAPAWVAGEFGTVTLDSPPRKMVVVPTRALILDRGKWWVLVHTPKGDRPQQVLPGPAKGWDTYLLRGLRPGTQIVVANAFLLFHRGISQNFQMPD